ncbi:MAG: UDP-N-acetylmuramate--L-alanine ligase [Oscillospiraceae bacterium]|nr:UDP-N-acetylmuramate--L-alanine ligase [Oscillospiraceae bacterium]
MALEGKNPLEGKKRLHFIGIGGSGMFPIVQILHSQGYLITGSDNNESDILKLVRGLGIPVQLGQRAENIEGAELIVYTSAIMDDNPELVAARESGLPLLERSDVLGYLTSLYDNTVCVCGTHGKTTTTAMLTQILMDSGADPSAVIGGKLHRIGGYGRVGHSGTMVCESCEFSDHFLKLHPDVAVILNIDEDHLDYFKTLENIIRSFRTFAEKAARLLIYNGDDANTRKAVEGLGKEAVTFGFSEENDYYPANIISLGGTRQSFELFHQKSRIAEIRLNVAGRHNVLDAVAACAAALACGVPAEGLAAPLADFNGAGRRFELLGEVNGVTIVDDYAHHPAELRVTLEAAKKLDFKRVWAVFQPFTYSRTALLFDDFVEVLQIADRVVLSEIMGSREKNTYNIYSKDLCAKMPGSVWFDTFEEIRDYVLENAEPGDLVITLGCGDIYKAAKLMLNL